MQVTSFTVTPCPPVPTRRGHMLHFAAIIGDGEGTVLQQSRPTDAALSAMARPKQVAYLTGTPRSDISTISSHEDILLTFGTRHTDPRVG